MADLEFKPVNPGIGFHPFSEGLPYQAPTPPAGPSQGSGAVAAGPPRYAPPQKQMPKPAPFPVPVPKQEPPVPQPEPRLEFSSYYFPKRILSQLFDLCLNTALVAGALVLVLWQMKIPLSTLVEPGVGEILAGFLIAFHVAISISQQVAFHTTLGMRIFGLRLTQDLQEPSTSRILLRSLLFPLSLLTLGLFRIHDKWSGVFPVETADIE
jgi:uncharacterized RDD family membrane protein YckC